MSDPLPLPNWTANIDDLKQFSQIRLIVFDIDGTLLKSNMQIDDLQDKIPRFIRRLSHYKGRTRLTIATGRTLKSVKTLLMRMPIKNVPIILYNGSLILTSPSKHTQDYSFQVIDHRSIPKQDLQEVLTLVHKYPVRILAYYYIDPLFYIGPSEDQEYVLGWTNKTRPERDFNGMTIQWQNRFCVGDGIDPTTILIDTSEDSSVVPIIETRLSKIPNISYTRSDSRFIELRTNGCNKGVALQRVAEYLNLNRNEVLALGDNDNDVEMLEWAGIGVAIAQASPATINSSDFVCVKGPFQGTIEVLHLITIAKRYFS